MAKAELIAGQPMAEYRATPALNYSTIKHGRKSMLHMHYAATHPTEPTAAMSMGTILHAAILETEDFCRRVAIWDKGDKRGNAWKEFKAEHANGYILKPHEHADVMRAVAAVHGDSMAHDLIQRTVHERAVYWRGKHYGAAKGRTDGMTEDGKVLFDLKSTANIEKHFFTANTARMGLHLQLGWYSEGIEANTGHAPELVFVIAFEQEGAIDAAVYEVPPGVVTRGREEAVEIARKYRVCEAAGSFPGVADGQILQYELPGWMTGDDGEVDFGEGE